ncbi:hypothetical protein Emin_0561 [Elusimicrobium minutum Pei191]|uniref:Uncharacterized protein n=1 Tax=Elusimicrobium minutum (strain Pei191) TaxID=445932 RepID=B2KBY9_ELUMP|nr:hypothetical protein [Elusimicrobium minutum]ACC98116.1 hypothetical protein Emin_0561 [Elusimicrobium minutum Pei191]
MNKIKKFKISLRRKEIARRILRSNLDLKAAGISDEFELDKFIVRLYAALNPGVVYKLFEEKSLELESIGIEHKDMFSACVVNLGPVIEEKIKEFDDNITLTTAANIVLFEFLKNAVQFVNDLIKEQAEKEEFETQGIEVLYTPIFAYAQEPKFLQEAPRIDRDIALKAIPVIFNSLNTEKIGVKFEEGIITPKATVAFLVPWNKKKKKRK